MSKQPSYSSQEWSRGNLISNADFSQGLPGAMPYGWEAVVPNRAAGVDFELVQTPSGDGALGAVGRSDLCLGYARAPVSLTGGKTYLMRARFRCEGIDDVHLRVVHMVSGNYFSDGIFTYLRDGDWIVGEERFAGPASDMEAEVRLYVRNTSGGRVQWAHVSLQECEPIPSRLVTLAYSSGRRGLEEWERWLDLAGERGADLALLPEFFGYGDLSFMIHRVKEVAQPLDGPLGRMMSGKARQHRMYVCGTIVESLGDLYFNAAPLYDRSGELVGVHRKSMLYEPEADVGISPGSEFNVLDADFGRLGIIICYETWFPEIVRLLAYKGAELILAPNAGYSQLVMPARAVDNGVWLAASSMNLRGGFWEPAGHRTLNAVPEMMLDCDRDHSSIVSFEHDEETGTGIVTFDMNSRYRVAWNGGPMRCCPAGQRCRQTLPQPIEDDISREARRWWKS